MICMMSMRMHTSFALKVEGVHGTVAAIVVVDVLRAGIQQFVHQRGLAVVNLRFNAGPTRSGLPVKQVRRVRGDDG